MDDIGRYQIKGELGSGGMGVVLRGYDPVLGREVAIKTLKVDDLADPAERDSLRDRLAREARAAAALSHPGIVAIFDVVQQGDLISLVMERIEGQNLANLFTPLKPPGIEVLLRIIRESASALDYAHKKGIVHRDIKPANLMLDEHGSVKVADFGIAKITTSQTRTQSASGFIVGTAGYMAPEQLKGAPVDGQADQFSLAVVAYEMLAHRRPFVADSIVALTHQVVFQEPPTLSTLRPGLGPMVDAVFQKALAKNPAERYPTCSEFAAALDMQINAAIREPTKAYPTPVPTAPLPPPKAPSQPYGLFGAIVAVLIAAGGFGAYFLRRAPEPRPAVVTPPPVTVAKTEPTPAKADLPAAAKTSVVEKPAKAREKLPPVAVKAGSVRVNKKDGQKYVWIPPGTFTMGCVPNDPNCHNYAKPAHRVTISEGFWMAQTETTVAAYKAFAEATHRELPKTPRFNPNWSLVDHPILNVTWDEAVAYASYAGGRLPTEAEWEYAARGGAVDTFFTWGNTPSHDQANFGQGNNATDETGAVEGRDKWTFTGPVASFPPNGFGLHDMTGNVSEWCADWFSPTYYTNGPEIDPKGPERGVNRVVRGGSWKSPAKFLHLSYRWNRPPDERGTTTGFRCVLKSLP